MNLIVRLSRAHPLPACLIPDACADRQAYFLAYFLTFPYFCLCEFWFMC